MLEKMGWSKGKGLGAQEQGATEHIKVQVKNNHLGLGAAINNEDNWIAHQDDFNQLLAELNTCHGQETTDSPDNKEKKSFGLEEKSKVSKNRVHYMKFTKGKDLSSRSKTDLDCIFGKRQSRKTCEDKCSPATEDRSETTATTTSTYTIQEYFAQRMAQLRSKPQHPTAEPGLSETHMGWKKGKKKTRHAADQDLENYPQTKARRPKKKEREEEKSQLPMAKKDDWAKWQSIDTCRDEASEDCVQAPGEQECSPKPKKSRAKTKLPQPVEIAVDAAPDAAAMKKKKKKKKASR
ncbi:PREDICTED: PIN2/TERF1-interacting telomerase inhibitor 1 isoform X2 [Chinchilla lanigera]|nr:PREDICTED: PIN2/TERF1-interacting telomerase inhibitor 1 isoform X2 [Chinchilla lanigera]